MENLDGVVWSEMGEKNKKSLVTEMLKNLNSVMHLKYICYKKVTNAAETESIPSKIFEEHAIMKS